MEGPSGGDLGETCRRSVLIAGLDLYMSVSHESSFVAVCGTMKKQNGIHWRMPTAMIVCFLLGLGLAIAHHFYYYALNGTTVGGQSKQEWALRLGTGLAFLTKTFLTTAVGIACVQNLWWILRLKPVRLSTLDSMFDIRGSIFNFFDLHIWLRGPNVAVLGLISWLIPLVTVVTPSTLSVQSSVRTAVSEQRIPNIIYDFDRYTTMSEGGPGAPTSSITRLVSSAVIQGSILNIPAPAPNSSYTLDFIAPFLQCNNASDHVSNTVNQYLRDKAAPRINYVGFTSSGNITADLDYLFTTTAYQRWYWHDVNETDFAGKLIISTYDQFPNRTVVECGMYNASYTVNFDFLNGDQSVEIANLTVLNRVLPVTELSIPTPPNEHDLFSYTAILNVLNSMLVGICWSYPFHCVGSQIYSTSLVNSRELWSVVFDDEEPQTESLPLGAAAAEMGRNITLSFFSNPFFLQNASQAKPVNVTFHQNENKYLYSEKNLLIAYGVSVFVSLLCVIAGLLTMWDNGLAFTDSFSTILRATRNPRFDEIVPKDCTTGKDPTPESLAKTRVQWTSFDGGDDGIAGLKPLSATAECEKVEDRESQSPLTYSHRLPQRKNYQPTVSDVDASREGFI